jgi:hypothetical protein
LAPSTGTNSTVRLFLHPQKILILEVSYRSAIPLIGMHTTWLLYSGSRFSPLVIEKRLVAIVDFLTKMRGINTVSLIDKNESFETLVALNPTKVYLLIVCRATGCINGAALTLVAKQALLSDDDSQMVPSPLIPRAKTMRRHLNPNLKHNFANHHLSTSFNSTLTTT